MQPAAAQQLSWYACLEGTIDKYPVQLHVHKAGPSVYGYYYYTSRQQPVYFTGDDTTYPGKLKLYVFGHLGEDGDEVFLLRKEGNRYTGEWTKGDQQKPLAVSVAPVQSAEMIPFDHIYTQGGIPLQEGLEGSPEASFFAASEWPAGNVPAVPYLKSFIRSAFDEKAGTKDIGLIFLEHKARFFDEYRADFKDEKVEELLESAYAFSQDMITKLMIVYQSPKLLTLSRFSYLYSGGAHGNYTTDYFSIDLEKQRRIGLNEILTAAGKQQLPKLLEKSFRKTYNLASNTPLTDGGLFENTIAPNDNYFITGKGIGFSYAPYEIGPYAMGEISIFIPFADLKAFLQPGIQAMLQ